MEFNSQICTTKEQSERLLALGLKKETADMHHYQYTEGGRWNIEARPSIAGYNNRLVPAWSLHRLIEIIPSFIEIGEHNYMFNIIQGKLFSYGNDIVGKYSKDSVYNSAIYTIEWLIKEGYFNKEYLEE